LALRKRKWLQLIIAQLIIMPATASPISMPSALPGSA
jgi:hypothetical protein